MCVCMYIIVYTIVTCMMENYLYCRNHWLSISILVIRGVSLAATCTALRRLQHRCQPVPCGTTRGWNRLDGANPGNSTRFVAISRYKLQGNYMKWLSWNSQCFDFFPCCNIWQEEISRKQYGSIIFIRYCITMHIISLINIDDICGYDCKLLWYIDSDVYLYIHICKCM